MEHTHASQDAAQAAPEQVADAAGPAAPFPLPVMAGVTGEARPTIRRAWAYRPDLAKLVSRWEECVG